MQVDRQHVQAAINACDRSHTETHRAIASLKSGSTTEAKQRISRAIAFLANALTVI